MTTYAIVFPKGGTTKTTTAAEHTALLAEQGRRVLAIDLDEQGTLSSWLGFTDASVPNGSAADVLTGRAGIAAAATPAPSVDGAMVLVGTHELAAVTTATVEDLVTSLRDLLPGVSHLYDDVVIDAPPALAGLSLAALAAADVVIAPVAGEAQAVDQIDRFELVIEAKIAARVRPGQRIHYLIPTRYDARRRVDREIEQDLRDTYGSRITVTAPIREAVVVKDSYISRTPLGRYAPASRPAQDYRAVLTQIIEETRA